MRHSVSQSGIVTGIQLALRKPAKQTGRGRLGTPNAGIAATDPGSLQCRDSKSVMRISGTDRVQLNVPCPFCSLPRDRLIFESELAVAFRDGFPVSPGHTLIIPRRHIASYFETTPGEQTQMLRLLAIVKADIDQQFQPAGYNIGINDGHAAGQTVMHVHMHLIPRFAGDRDDPRGGVRWIIPEKADYWTRRGE